MEVSSGASMSSPHSHSEMSLIPFDTGLRLADLVDCAEHQPEYVTRYSVTGMVIKSRRKRTEPVGKQIDINGRKVILWKVGKQVFATSPICPHQGSNLLLGDLEDLRSEGKGFCITCPAHNWKFSAVSGDCVNHKDSASILTTYPVFIDDSSRIFVRFQSFDSSLFSSQDF